MTERLKAQRQRLLQKICEDGPRPWASKHIPDPKICDSDTLLPKILYLHLGYERNSIEVVRNYLFKPNINKRGSLLSFTQNPLEVVHYDYCNRLRIPGTRESLLVILFPYESTNISRWAIDKNAHKNLPTSKVFLTDQPINREDTLLAGYTQLINKAEDKNIQAAQYSSLAPNGRIKAPELPREKQTKANIMKMFDITELGQEKIFEQLRLSLVVE